MAQRIRHQIVVGRQLVVQPDVANRHPQLLEQMEQQRELFRGKRLTGQPVIKHGDPDERFAVEDRDGHLRAQQFKLFPQPNIAAGFLGVCLKDPAVLQQVPPHARIERQLEMLEQTRGQADRARGAQPMTFRLRLGHAQRGGGHA